MWKQAHIPNQVIPPSTDDNGWILVGTDLEPKWCEGDILPSQLADILDKAIEKETERMDCDSDDDSSSDTDSDSESDSSDSD
jgi:hypothetical protein